MKRSLFPVSIVLLLIVLISSPAAAQVPTSASKATGPDSKVTYPAKNKDTFTVDQNKWKLVWADEFSGKDLDLTNWTRQVLPDPFNQEWQQYFDRKENAYVENGHLVLKAIHHSQVHGDNQYTSARLHTGNKHSWKYGKIAARIQLPYGKGIWPAFWMLGKDITEIGGEVPWPQCGEIDILEMYGTRDNAVVEGNLHYDNGGHNMTGAKPFKLKQGIFAEKFHVFEIEWDEKRIKWLVDGQKYHSVRIDNKKTEEFQAPFYILLNIAVGGQGAGRPDNSTEFPQTMYVDWVRVYQHKETQPKK